MAEKFQPYWLKPVKQDMELELGIFDIGQIVQLDLMLDTYWNLLKLEF
jgi:hypothetical protein